MEPLRSCAQAWRRTSTDKLLRQGSMVEAEAGVVYGQLRHQALLSLLQAKCVVAASSTGRPWWRGVGEKLLFFLCFGEEASAASSSYTRGGHACRRDSWPKGWPFFNLHLGGLLDPTPELGGSVQPSGSSPAAARLPASVVARRQGDSEWLTVLRSRRSTRLEVAGDWRRSGSWT